MIYFLFFQIVSSFVGDQLCSSMITANTCEQLGYCYWDYSSAIQQCRNEDCYKVDEIAACRTGGALVTVCKSLEMTPYNYIVYGNVCNELTDVANELVQYLIRYQYPTNGYADKSSDGITLALWNSLFPQYGYINQIYTISILKQDMTQLDQTLDIYLKYQTLMLYDTNLWSILQQEIAVAQMLQMLRDDMTLLATPKKAMISKVWTITDNLLQRYRISGTNYTMVYPLYTICQSTLSLLKITLTGYQYKVLFQWNQYTANGYVQILGYDLNQFGIIDTLTQVYEFNVYDYGHNTQSMQYAIQYTFPFDATTNPIYLATYDRSTLTMSALTAIICTYDSIITFTTSCLLPSLTTNTQYFLTRSIASCTSITKRYKCKQPTCKWDDISQTCQIA